MTDRPISLRRNLTITLQHSLVVCLAVMHVSQFLQQREVAISLGLPHVGYDTKVLIYNPQLYTETSTH